MLGLIVILTRGNSFLQPAIVEGFEPRYSFLWLYFDVFFKNESIAPFLQFLDALLVFIEALMINRLLIKHQLMPQGSLLPAFIFIIISSIFKDWMRFDVVSVSILLSIYMLHWMLQLSDEEPQRYNIFFGGLLISIASLFYIPTIFLIPAFLYTLLIRTLAIRDYLLFALSLIFPLYIIGIYFYYESELSSYLVFWKAVIESTPDLPNLPLQETGFILVLIVLGLYGVLNLILFSDEFKVIKMRRQYISLLLLGASIVMGGVFIQNDIIVYMKLLTIPLTVFLSAIFIRDTIRWYHTFCFYVIIIGVIYFQIKGYLIG